MNNQFYIFDLKCNDCGNTMTIIRKIYPGEKDDILYSYCYKCNKNTKFLVENKTIDNYESVKVKCKKKNI